MEAKKLVVLTPAQRTALMLGANNGGMFPKQPQLAFSVHQTLQFLGLIEQRSCYSPAEIKERNAKMRNLWTALVVTSRQKNSRAAEKALGDIRNLEWHADDKAWFLTPAAQEYLLYGEVLVTVAKLKVQAAGASGPVPNKPSGTEERHTGLSK